MKLRARIIKALMKKDFRMLAGNKNTFFILLLPILFCVLYTKVLPIGKETGMLYPLLLCEVLNLICADLTAEHDGGGGKREKYPADFDHVRCQGYGVSGQQDVCCTFIDGSDLRGELSAGGT